MPSKSYVSYVALARITIWVGVLPKTPATRARFRFKNGGTFFFRVSRFLSFSCGRSQVSFDTLGKIQDLLKPPGPLLQITHLAV